MKKIIIFTYMQRHFQKMLPLIQELQDNGKVHLHVIIMTYAEKSLALSKSITFQMLDDFMNENRKSEIDYGWGLKALINAINIIKPDLFIAIEVNYILRNAVHFCKTNNIKSIIIQHGTPNIFSLHAFVPFDGDFFLAWGEYTKAFLIENGVEESKIVVTGGISFDRTLKLIPNKDKVSKTIKSIPNPRNKWIVFATQTTGTGGLPSIREIKKSIEITSQKVKEHSNADLIFQVHPQQNITEIMNYVGELQSPNIHICKYHDTEELICSSDAFITYFSTTALDAFILNKPILLINLEDDKDFLPLASLGVAHTAFNENEIGIKFNQLVNDTGIWYDKGKIEYMNYKNDGRALKRIVDFCYSIIEI